MSTYQLRAGTDPGHGAAPVLDASQQAVVDHPGGPLLVLAGPGTGKTTTLVESVVDRVERRGLSPEQVLVLTFSRQDADELRHRIGARLGRTSAGTHAATFHSFCYALVRRFSDPVLYGRPLSLLSAPEQDVALRELLAGSRRGGTVVWPAALTAAMGTRGLAAEMRALTARARSLRLDPEDLVARGVEHDRAEWVAAGQFFAEALTVLDHQAMIDYAELVHRATIIATDHDHQARLRAEIGFVVVDEYQDTDPAQVALLRALAGDGRDLLVVGDPDQSIYGFRGADVRGLLSFPSAFPTGSGENAPVLALQSTRRFGPALLAASRGVVDRLPVPGSLDRATFEHFRQPGCAAPPYGDGSVQVRTFTSPAAEAEHIAVLLRRSHLDDGLPWSQMAVLVRSGVRSIPRLQRALAAAEVPVEVAGDELPLGAQPAVQTLLRALRMAQLLADARPSDAQVAGARAAAAGVTADPVSTADPPAAWEQQNGAASLPWDDVAALLCSPIGGMGAGAVRRLSAALRHADRELHEGERPPQPSGRLLALAVADPDRLLELPGQEAGEAYRAAGLLLRAADLLVARAGPEEVLWAVWSGTDWPARLRRAADSGAVGAAAAHRDLDAVCVLFDLAARADERQQRRLSAFLDEVEAQQIPADTLAERGRGEAVRLLTAHRAKGLEWRLVVVAAVQEDTWPALRHRGSLLATDLLGQDGPLPAGPSTAQLLAEERRLFYVAVTRARQRLVVTAVHATRAGGEQRSRFVEDLGVEVGMPVGRPSRALSLRGLLGDLRARAETTDDPALRAALAHRIARLAVCGHVPAAHPDQWWGVRDLSEAAVPVRPVDAPLSLSGSAVEAITACPLRWFLSREAGGATRATTAQGFGGIVHALAASVVDGDLPAESDALLRELDRVWGQLEFPVSWGSATERAEAAEAIAAFLDWHHEERGRRSVAAEVPFEVSVPVGADEVVLRGSLDRVELDREGRGVVVDLKTGKSAPTGADVDAHPQLGVYQVAVRAGAADQAAGRPVAAGGAELVQLRARRRAGVKVQHQPAPVHGAPFDADTQLAGALRVVRDETFVATPGPGCRHCEFRTTCPAWAEGRSILDVVAERGDPQLPDEGDLAR